MEKKYNYGFKVLKTSSCLMWKISNKLIKINEMVFPKHC